MYLVKSTWESFVRFHHPRNKRQERNASLQRHQGTEPSIDTTMLPLKHTGLNAVTLYSFVLKTISLCAKKSCLLLVQMKETVLRRVVFNLSPVIWIHNSADTSHYLDPSVLLRLQYDRYIFKQKHSLALIQGGMQSTIVSLFRHVSAFQFLFLMAA